MDKQDDLSEEDVETTMLLNSDQMFVIMKALDASWRERYSCSR